MDIEERKRNNKILTLALLKDLNKQEEECIYLDDLYFDTDEDENEFWKKVLNCNILSNLSFFAANTVLLPPLNLFKFHMLLYRTPISNSLVKLKLSYDMIENDIMFLLKALKSNATLAYLGFDKANRRVKNMVDVNSMKQLHYMRNVATFAYENAFMQLNKKCICDYIYFYLQFSKEVLPEFTFIVQLSENKTEAVGIIATFHHLSAGYGKPANYIYYLWRIYTLQNILIK